MHFILMLDRSGSMANVMEQVKATSRQFLAALPANAYCSVVSFASGWSDHTGGKTQQCSGLKLDEKISAGGGTDLYTPLAALYRHFGAPGYVDWQTAVIIITDGAINSSNAERTKAELLAAKGKVKTFVFWLGDHTEKHLAGLADAFISRQGEITPYLSEVYGAVGEAYRKQQVLKPRACTK